MEPAREEPAQPVRSARGSREEQDRVGAAPGTAPSGVRQRPTPEPDPQGQDVPAEPAPETDEPRQQRRQMPAPEAGRPEPERLPDRVVVLHVVAGQGYVFPASVVVAEVEALGLLLDENYLFQAFPGQDRRRTPWFGVASMVAPGVFPPGQVDRMETPGVALFMQVPGPVAGVEIFNQMLDTARRLAARLDGLLLDDRRKRITAETINRLQEELSAYGRQTGDRD